MEALYTNSLIKSRENTSYRRFFKYFPKEVFGSTDKNQFYHTKERLYALKDFKWIQYNSEDRLTVLSVDIDNSSDSLLYQDFSLPVPTWIIQTDKGFQYHWALKTPIFLKGYNSKKLRYIVKDILNKLVALLDGDFNAIGLNRVFRSPTNNRTWFSGNEVDLSEFYDLPTPKEEIIDKILEEVKENKKNSSLKGLSEGEGRNCALFDKLRHWAYSKAKEGSYNLNSLQMKAETLNFEFNEIMDLKEVTIIVNSIDEFIQNKYKRIDYMALSPEERKKIATKNGKKSGEARTKEARTKILTALNTMEAYEIKITVSELARRSGTNPKTTRAYLKELGFKEKSRTEGWIK